MDNNKYKVCVLGDGNVGKTTWIRRLISHTAEKRYVATLGVEVHPIHLETNRGVFTFNIWDTAGQERFGGLRDGYYISSDAFIFVHTGDLSNLERWKRSCTNYSSGRPQITICNTHEPLIEGDIDLLYGDNPYDPLLYLLRELHGDPHIYLL